MRSWKRTNIVVRSTHLKIISVGVSWHISLKLRVQINDDRQDEHMYIPENEDFIPKPDAIVGYV